MPQLRESGLAWMVLAQLLFAAMNICTRLGSARVPWPEVASARFLIGALLAAGVAAGRGTSLQIIDQPGAWRRSIFGALSAVGAFYTLSSPRIAIGDAATLTATAPIFVALLSGALLNEPVGRRVWFAVAFGFSGVLALVRPSFPLALPVAVVATAGSFFYALAMIWLRRSVQQRAMKRSCCISLSWPSRSWSCWPCPSGAGLRRVAISTFWARAWAVVEHNSP